jgi:hypothetical protein
MSAQLAGKVVLITGGGRGIGCEACHGRVDLMRQTVKAETLWRLAWQYLPEVMPSFERISQAIGTAEEGRTIEAAYRRMPALNFSSHLLERIPHAVATIELSGLIWSDWGNPGRITSTLERIGKTPRFPVECMKALEAV